MDIRLVRKQAHLEGFEQMAVVSAGSLEAWLECARLRGLPDRLEANPQSILPDARTVLVLLDAYHPYAQGPRSAMHLDGYYIQSNQSHQAAARLCAWLEENGIHARSGDALSNKRYAILAGMGSYGRNELVLHPSFGSRIGFRLIVTDHPFPALPFDAALTPQSPACAGCRRCHVACPSGALSSDGFTYSRCIRAHMLSGQIVPEALRVPMGRNLTGCDRCQAACPENAAVTPLPYPDELAQVLDIHALLEDFSSSRKAALAALIGANFTRKTRIQSQAIIAAANMRDVRCLAALERFTALPDPLATHARWALLQFERA